MLNIEKADVPDQSKICHWGDSLSTDETNLICIELALSIVSRISHGPTSSELASLIASKDYAGLCAYAPQYGELSHRPLDALYARQISAFWQKREDLCLGIDREEVAFNSFLRSERSCFDTNTFLKEVRGGRAQTRPHVSAWMFHAQRKIADILGEVPSLAELRFRYGPGSMTTVKKRESHPRYKLGRSYACSGDLTPIAAELLGEMPSLIDFPVGENKALVDLEVHSGRLGFVPKNYKTDRSVVTEPPLNVLYQLGMGDYITDRLRSFGVDLSDQTRNQRLARSGSIDGELATLDLSSASDTISRELVWDLLPHDWAQALSYGRTSHVTYKRRGSSEAPLTFVLEKFSSMGNGFTFPLQTLIFYALAMAVCRTPLEKSCVSVYGDDIILPSHRFAELRELLGVCGFTLNIGKSFHDGPFRESCGADYLLGTNIRPTYLRNNLSGETLFILHNGLRRSSVFDIECSMLLSYATPDWLIFGPDGYGDGHLIGAQVPLEPFGLERGYGGFTFMTYTWEPRTSKRECPRGEASLPAYSIYASKPFGEDVPMPWNRATVSLLRRLALQLRDIVPASWYSYDKRGKLKVRVPGTKGYRKVKVYTFASS